MDGYNPRIPLEKEAEVEGDDVIGDEKGDKVARHWATSQGMWAAPGRWKRQKLDFSPGNSRRNSLPTP